ncbi:T9SS type A sorting domain-containing protein [Phaeocystidibacter marisrubri]|uniref:T9SS type A sorting domain-containing protein n=1 Tax=Phaeocystidibacter marisrubri TaxID=1577780 RepID=A0A6L3ZIG2_9FLAO|nr:T9SS type A sorting domain-containing protein [Phaeocystidibacter marisrubri]KAB2817265.1 T9SS type A sorting domain-containing protein [Phaeocystidibacter marisrubri]GGH76182.1 hypothetical protein GCM10011318_24060 [Phaeocystidibacter marisrubri]
MKNGRLLLGLVGISVVGSALFATQSLQARYTPRATSSGVEAIAGAAEYLNSLRVDITTGTVDPRMEQEARRQASALSSNKTLNLQWESLGPANSGGRARALLVDRDSSNIVYAASVSGGLYRSRTSGSSWIPVSPMDENLAVVSICQATNGDIYYGTGEFPFIGYFGNGASSTPAFIGGGIFKSTDNGKTFTVLPNTVPSSPTTNDGWAAVGDIEADPNDANTIYAATPGGLRRSQDGGQTWSIVLSGFTRDFTIDVNGNLYVDNGSRLMYSSTGNAGDWTELSSGSGMAGTLPRTQGRMRIAVSPQDPNYIYVVEGNGSQLKGVYRSIDAGATWTQIGTKGAQFDPMCSGSSCQGIYDLLFSVSAKDKNRIWFGGITLWTWYNGQWSQVNTTNDSPGNPYYIHSDLHELISDPKNPDILWLASDGGIFKSSDHGVTWGERNLNFRTIQFYKFGLGQDRSLLGGTQDNGTQLIDGSQNFASYSTRLQINNKFADGGEAEISWLVPKVMFGENQNGDLGRSENNGESFSAFYEGNMKNLFQPMSGGFANWIMPYELYEDDNDLESIDSVMFYAFPASQSLGFGNGTDVTFTSTLSRPYAPAVFDASSFEIVSGALSLQSDAAGNLTGDGTGTFDAATGTYMATFNTAPLAEIVVTCNVSYPAGSEFRVPSKTGGLLMDVQLTQTLGANDTAYFQDVVQSFLIAGLTSHDNNGAFAGGIWMTREALDFSGTPDWWKVAQLQNGESPLSMTVTSDGDICYVGTTSGRLYRISNLDAARTDDADILFDTVGQPTPVAVDLIRSFGRNVTSVSVDPNDNDRVIATLGNYGQTDYVYYSTNATSASPVFTSKQGNLPAMPVYASSFDKGDAGAVLLGTELGMFAIQDIDAAGTPQWTNENNGMPMVPVFEIEQYRTNKLSPADTTIVEGDFYIATHGRGFYRTGSTLTNRPVSVEENEMTFNNREELNIFPNPAKTKSTIAFELNATSEVSVTVRDLNGRVVRSINYGRMGAGEQTVEVNFNGLSAGAYMVSLANGSTINTAKVIVQR